MIEEDLAKLNTMNINELKKLFLRYFNARPTLKTKETYILKLSYRMQELEFGGLSSTSRSFLSKISSQGTKCQKGRNRADRNQNHQTVQRPRLCHPRT